MPYTFIDIINSFIEIEKKAISIYEAILNNGNAEKRLITVAKVLILEEERHLENYKKLITDMVENGSETVELSVYNSICSMYYEFNKEFKEQASLTIFELLKYAIDLENLNLKLLMNIQQLLFSNRLTIKYKSFYDIINNLIETEREHIRNLFLFINKPS